MLQYPILAAEVFIIAHIRVPQVPRCFFAPLFLAALSALLAWPQPAHADACAESPAGRRAGVLYAEGESEAALPYGYQALAYAEQNCGAGNIAIVTLLADLAAIHQDMQRYDEAEKLLERVIDIKQAALSPEEEDKPGAALPNMIIDLDNLAFVYGAQGKFAEAGILFERVLAIAEHAVGENHIIVSQALRNLAENYRAEGRYSEAAPLLARAVRIEAVAADDIPANWAETLGLSPEKAHAIGYKSEAEALLRLLEGDKK